MSRHPRVTQRAALDRIERMTRGYDHLSANGMIHALAAAALGLRLSVDERRVLIAEQERQS